MKRTWWTRVFGILAMLAAVLSFGPGPSVLGQTRRPPCIYFKPANQYFEVCGAFSNYWQDYGGLPQQGYPLSNTFDEVSDLNGQRYKVQYFERAVFELHPENAGTPAEVLLSLLGKFQYDRKYPNGAPGQHANQTPGNSQFFQQTGHWVGGKFWTYWQEHGGLKQQGYPISEEFTEVSDLNGTQYTVQYFERAVFELHPENAGTPAEVLLSQLGTLQYKRKYPNGAPGQLQYDHTYLFKLHGDGGTICPDQALSWTRCKTSNAEWVPANNQKRDFGLVAVPGDAMRALPAGVLYAHIAPSLVRSTDLALTGDAVVSLIRDQPGSCRIQPTSPDTDIAISSGTITIKSHENIIVHAGQICFQIQGGRSAMLRPLQVSTGAEVVVGVQPDNSTKVAVISADVPVLVSGQGSNVQLTTGSQINGDAAGVLSRVEPIDTNTAQTWQLYAPDNASAPDPLNLANCTPGLTNELGPGLPADILKGLGCPQEPARRYPGKDLGPVTYFDQGLLLDDPAGQASARYAVYGQTLQSLANWSSYSVQAPIADLVSTHPELQDHLGKQWTAPCSGAPWAVQRFAGGLVMNLPALPPPGQQPVCNDIRADNTVVLATDGSIPYAHLVPSLVPTITPTNTPTNTPTPAILGEDCLPYNPANLRIVDEGATGWLLTDSISRMLILDNQTDAQNALALAQRYTSHCFIGRNNTRPNRSDYIVQYWTGDSGISTTLIQEDCILYNPANLQIVDEGATGWLLTDNISRMLTLDNQADAQNALTLARRYSNQCFIGRNNTRPNRRDYIVEYWK